VVVDEGITELRTIVKEVVARTIPEMDRFATKDDLRRWVAAQP
jgi:hypothetical protein